MEISTTGITPDRVQKHSPFSSGVTLYQGNLFSDYPLSAEKHTSKLQKVQILHSAISRMSVLVTV